MQKEILCTSNCDDLHEAVTRSIRKESLSESKRRRNLKDKK